MLCGNDNASHRSSSSDYNAFVSPRLHSPAYADDLSDKVIVLDAGNIVEEGKSTIQYIRFWS